MNTALRIVHAVDSLYGGIGMNHEVVALLNERKPMDLKALEEHGHHIFDRRWGVRYHCNRKLKFIWVVDEVFSRETADIFQHLCNGNGIEIDQRTLLFTLIGRVALGRI